MKTRVRVGDEDSPVMAGEPSPTGGIYRSGQYAPTIDELSSQTLVRAKEAGLLQSLPIFDEDGSVNQKKLELWEPSIRGVHIDSGVPKFASAVLQDVFTGREGLAKELNLARISSGTREEQNARTIFGEVIVKSVYNAKDGFTGKLVIYPSFYKYVTIPLVGKFPGRDSGLSVAAYAVFHALGHLKFAQLMSTGNLQKIAEVLGESGWTKNPDKGVRGEYFEYKNPSGWSRRSNSELPSEVSGYSPSDDFAEMFALYLTNKGYFKEAYPERYELMEKML